jgi:hypothetical protein
LDSLEQRQLLEPELELPQQVLVRGLVPVLLGQEPERQELLQQGQEPVEGFSDP